MDDAEVTYQTGCQRQVSDNDVSIQCLHNTWFLRKVDVRKQSIISVHKRLPKSGTIYQYSKKYRDMLSMKHDKSPYFYRDDLQIPIRRCKFHPHFSATDDQAPKALSHLEYNKHRSYQWHHLKGDRMTRYMNLQCWRTCWQRSRQYTTRNEKEQKTSASMLKHTRVLRSLSLPMKEAKDVTKGLDAAR